MDTAEKRLYEGLFLVDSAQAAADWEGVNQSIEKVLVRSEAEIVSIKKWDDRRLAYEINGHARGTYILVYFNAVPTTISTIERDVQLSEQILRVMILRTDKMSSEDIDKATPAKKAEKADVPAETSAPETTEPEAEIQADEKDDVPETAASETMEPEAAEEVKKADAEADE